jgi:NitT/TauT family transport system substrate-binding protein
MSRKIVKVLVPLVLLVAAALTLAGCGSATTQTTATTKLAKLTLVAPPGPMAIPMAYIAANNRLADVAETTEVVIWENADQLKAFLAGGQGDFVTVPSNNAATFYNKGIKLRLLDISVWNITYLITSDAQAASFSDIKGQSLVVPFQGSVPDVMFQYLATKEGLDPNRDFDLRYAADPTEAAQLLLAGQVKNAVLSEPLATAVLLQSKDKPTPLHRALAFDIGWLAASGVASSDTAPPSGGSPAGRTPIAGVVATAGVMDKPEVIAAFEREYAAAVEWLVANPEEAGQLLETELPQLGVKAAVMTASLKNIAWDHQTAQEARTDLEAFFTALMDLSPAVIGGRLPDDAFYYSE